ncbi:hypothetical protein EDD18DRAFT_1183828 [Armillaria luteobubalina]|uniref:Uncharacterized protein n=1 Tax=Armillaria luteobubalina TaxID=153913 RepID=A0AA39PYE4_9AGAR|nr:hypothetical protein EDD18DRAFT_1183828 [Armillaria luteobubalina]
MSLKRSVHESLYVLTAVLTLWHVFCLWCVAVLILSIRSRDPRYASPTFNIIIDVLDVFFWSVGLGCFEVWSHGASLEMLVYF